MAQLAKKKHKKTHKQPLVRMSRDLSRLVRGLPVHLAGPACPRVSLSPCLCPDSLLSRLLSCRPSEVGLPGLCLLSHFQPLRAGGHGLPCVSCGPTQPPWTLHPGPPPHLCSRALVLEAPLPGSRAILPHMTVLRPCRTAAVTVPALSPLTPPQPDPCPVIDHTPCFLPSDSSTSSSWLRLTQTSIPTCL